MGSGVPAYQDGPALSAALGQPAGVAWDASGGRLFFTDMASNTIRALYTANGTVATVSHRLSW